MWNQLRLEDLGTTRLRVMPSLALALVALLLQACGPSPGASDGGPVVALPGCPEGGTTVRGTAMLTYVSPAPNGGSMTRPLAATEVPRRALAVVDGGFCASEATTTDGVFTISRVPEGQYLLQANATHYVATTSRSPDVGFDTLGRPDVVEPKEQASVLLNLTGLTPWATGSELQLVAANADTFVFGLEQLLSRRLASGATSLSAAFDYRYAAFPANLLDSAKGDEALIVQLVARATAGGVPYRAAAKQLKFAPFTMYDGYWTMLSGGFTNIGASDSISLQWQRSQFVSLGASLNPSAVPGDQALVVDLLPESTARGFYTSAPDLLVVDQASGTTDVSLTDAAFANPYPSDWPIFVGAHVGVSVSYMVPGATMPHRHALSVGTTLSRAAATAAPIVPLVGPVLSPLINGSNAFDEASGVGLTPTLSWTAPALGPPTSYSVRAVRLFPAEYDVVAYETMALIVTTSTSVRVPPGVLSKGQYYFFVITSLLNSGIDANEHPYRNTLPSGWAQVATARFSP